MGRRLHRQVERATGETRQFGNRLKAARILQGYHTAEEFARVLGIEPSRYRMYERGDREAPYDLLRQMAIRLGVSIDQLLGVNRPAAAAAPQRNDLVDRLLQAGQRITALPERDTRSEDAILGYGEDGLPR